MKNVNDVIKENRGAERKYFFDNMRVGDKHTYASTTTSTLLNCAKLWAKTNGLDWKFRCFTESFETGEISIVRVK